MKTTSILFIASFLFFLTTNINAELYMWVDENGVKHYSDTGPDEDAIFEERGEYELDKSEPGKNNIKARAKILKEQRAERARQRKKLYKKTERKPKRKYELISLSVYPEGNNYIEVTGRVARGEPCERLKVSVYLTSSKGGRAHVSGIIEKAGGAGSKSMTDKDYVYGHAKDDWDVSSSYFNCVSD